MSVPGQTPELTVVLPVYNEPDNIGPTLRRLAATVHVPAETLVVYDFDADTTVPVVRALQAELPEVRLLRNDLGRGVLNAMKAGIAAARGDFVLITMADGSDEVELVERMVGLARGGADVVAASRYMKGGRQEGGPLLKRTLSRLAGLSLHWVGRLPIHDATNNFKLYRRAFLESSRSRARAASSWHRAQRRRPRSTGRRLAELPRPGGDRTAGQSPSLRAWLPLPALVPPPFPRPPAVRRGTPNAGAAAGVGADAADGRVLDARSPVSRSAVRRLGLFLAVVAGVIWFHLPSMVAGCSSTIRSARRRPPDGAHLPQQGSTCSTPRCRCSGRRRTCLEFRSSRPGGAGETPSTPMAALTGMGFLLRCVVAPRAGSWLPVWRCGVRPRSALGADVDDRVPRRRGGADHALRRAALARVASLGVVGPRSRRGRGGDAGQANDRGDVPARGARPGLDRLARRP
jgi:hypothetical protein